MKYIESIYLDSERKSGATSDCRLVKLWRTLGNRLGEVDGSISKFEEPHKSTHRSLGCTAISKELRDPTGMGWGDC